MTHSGRLTGRKVLVILLLAFGTIVTANLALVFSALYSFPGLDVKNSYVASQQFDALAKAQNALHWHTKTTYAQGVYSIFITDKFGKVVHPESLSLRIGRTTFSYEDTTFKPLPTATGYAAQADLASGKWQVWIDATSQSGVAYSIVLPLMVGLSGG